MEPKNFSSPERPRWVSGRGFWLMSEDADDAFSWSESKSYYVNFDTKTNLWSLMITTATKQKGEDDLEFEKSNVEIIGPHQIFEFRAVLAHYGLELDDQEETEIVKRLNNKHLL
jgi:hypothetical protein